MNYFLKSEFHFIVWFLSEIFLEIIEKKFLFRRLLLSISISRLFNRFDLTRLFRRPFCSIKSRGLRIIGISRRNLESLQRYSISSSAFFLSLYFHRSFLFSVGLRLIPSRVAETRVLRLHGVFPHRRMACAKRNWTSSFYSSWIASSQLTRPGGKNGEQRALYRGRSRGFRARDARLLREYVIGTDDDWIGNSSSLAAKRGSDYGENNWKEDLDCTLLIWLNIMKYSVIIEVLSYFLLSFFV